MGNSSSSSSTSSASAPASLSSSTPPSQIIATKLLESFIQDLTSLQSRPISISDTSFLIQSSNLSSYPVLNTSHWPYSANGLISIQINDTTMWHGSGTCIGPCLVLTAAHNLYDKESIILPDAKNITYYPVRSSNSAYNISSGERVIEIFIPDEYFSCCKDEESIHDYALLVLESSINTGYYGIKHLSESELSAKTVYICGYPANKMHRGNFEMWSCTGSCEIQDNSIVHNLDTYRGMSGAALWYTENDQINIIGIHSYEYSNLNFATYLTPSKISRIQSWIETSIYRRFLYHGILEGYRLDLSNIAQSCDIFDILSYIPSNIQHLDLSSNLINIRHIQELIKVEFKELNSLNLANNKIGSKGLRSLCKGIYPRLSRLNLSCNGIGARGLREMKISRFERLNEIILGGNRLNDIALKYLAECKMSMLKYLDLNKNRIGPKGVGYLQKCKFEMLEYLNLEGNDLGNDGIEALKECRFYNLKSLYLGSNSISSIGIQHIAGWNFPMLSYLSLSNNSIDDIEFVTLNLESLTFRYSLHTLNLSNNSISSLNIPLSNLQHLDISYNLISSLSLSKLYSLQTLNLQHNNLSYLNVFHLPDWNLTMLKLLNLRYNSIGPEGVDILSRSKLEHITELDLGCNYLTHTGIQALTYCNFPNLESLHLDSNNIGPRGIVFLTFCKFDRLKHLNLDSNDVDSSILELRVSTFPNLCSLSVQNNVITTQISQLLSKSLSSVAISI